MRFKDQKPYIFEYQAGYPKYDLPPGDYVVRCSIAACYVLPWSRSWGEAPSGYTKMQYLNVSNGDRVVHIPPNGFLVVNHNTSTSTITLLPLEAEQ